MAEGGGRRALPAALAAAARVPVLAGLGGALGGRGFFGEAGPPAAESHLRYLSGLLLGLGLAFWWCAADLGRRRGVFGLLCGIVALGGLARLLGLALAPLPPWPHLLGLGMELGVTPALWAWSRQAG